MSPKPSLLEKSKPLVENSVDSIRDLKRVVALKDKSKDKKQSLLTWMMFLLVSIFGVVMALPLLQL